MFCIWLLLSLAFGADIDIESRGKPLLVSLDGGQFVETPQNLKAGEGFHEITAKLDLTTASALQIKFVVFNQPNGTLVFDWKKQQADLMWPGEERLKTRERALLRHRELSLAKRPGMFVLPTVSEEKAFESAEELPFVEAVVIVDPEEAAPDLDLDLEEEPPPPEPVAATLELDDLDDYDRLGTLLDAPEPLADVDGPDDEQLDDGDELEGPPVMDLNFDEFVADEAEPAEFDEVDFSSIQIAPVSSKETSKGERVRKSGGLSFKPWMAGAGAAAIAGGCFGQAGIQWAQAQGYSERARTMSGSAESVGEYLFNVDLAQQKSATTRAMIGVGSAVLVSGVVVSFTIGGR